ncbi:MAG: hypothetical protein OCD76_16365 [Reichenbachiella sp.]
MYKELQFSIKATSYLLLIGAMSCTWEQESPTFDCKLDPVEVELLASNATGCGTPNGGFTIGNSGGEAPFTYSSEAGVSADGVFESVGAGSYTVVVTDVNGCSGETIVEILNTDGVNLDDLLTTDAGCNSSEGIIEILASGGTEPYLYSIDNGGTQESNIFLGLESGDHNVSIEDQDGCAVTQNVVLTSGISFSTIEGIIENNCRSCHGVTRTPNFDTYDEINAAASRIKTRTSSENNPMPPRSNGSLTQSEIDAIACWVNDGALPD